MQRIPRLLGSSLLGFVQPPISGVQQSDWRCCVLGVERDSNAGGNVDSPLCDLEGIESASSIFSATSSPSSRCWAPVIITVNSSPPNRATVSSSRTQPVIRAATSYSRASPVSWPNESLTSLKPFRSMKSKEKGRLLLSFATVHFCPGLILIVRRKAFTIWRPVLIHSGMNRDRGQSSEACAEHGRAVRPCPYAWQERCFWQRPPSPGESAPFLPG